MTTRLERLALLCVFVGLLGACATVPIEPTGDQKTLRDAERRLQALLDQGRSEEYAGGCHSLGSWALRRPQQFLFVYCLEVKDRGDQVMQLRLMRKVRAQASASDPDEGLARLWAATKGLLALEAKRNSYYRRDPRESPEIRETTEALVAAELEAARREAREGKLDDAQERFNRVAEALDQLDPSLCSQPSKNGFLAARPEVFALAWPEQPDSTLATARLAHRLLGVLAPDHPTRAKIEAFAKATAARLVAQLEALPAELPAARLLYFRLASAWDPTLDEKKVQDSAERLAAPGRVRLHVVPMSPPQPRSVLSSTTADLGAAEGAVKASRREDVLACNQLEREIAARLDGLGPEGSPVLEVQLALTGCSQTVFRGKYRRGQVDKVVSVGGPQKSVEWSRQTGSYQTVERGGWAHNVTVDLYSLATRVEVSARGRVEVKGLGRTNLAYVSGSDTGRAAEDLAGDEEALAARLEDRAAGDAAATVANRVQSGVIDAIGGVTSAPGAEMLEKALASAAKQKKPELWDEAWAQSALHGKLPEQGVKWFADRGLGDVRTLFPLLAAAAGKRPAPRTLVDGAKAPTFPEPLVGAEMEQFLGAGGCPTADMAVVPGGTLALAGSQATVPDLCVDVDYLRMPTYALCSKIGTCAAEDPVPPYADDDSPPDDSFTLERAEAYCRAAGKRLPTDLEWQWIARGGSNDALGQSGEIPCEYATRQGVKYLLGSTILGHHREWTRSASDGSPKVCGGQGSCDLSLPKRLRSRFRCVGTYSPPASPPPTP